MIVVDTSALGKLLVSEPDSEALRFRLGELAGSGETFAISTIAVTELRHLTIRITAPPDLVDSITRQFRVLRLTEGILQLAGRLPHRHLGTLDAIHVATALVAEATTLLTYDVRQSEAALAEGLRVLAPRS